MRNDVPFSHALPVPRESFHAPLYVTHAGWERILPGQDYPVVKPAVCFFTWEEGRMLPEFCLALPPIECGAQSGTTTRRTKLLPPGAPGGRV
jgi:hypothetical protein